MLLKKILYGYKRVHAISIEGNYRDIEDSFISFEFHRYRPLGRDKTGHSHFNNTYIPKNPGKYISRIRYILHQSYFFGYDPVNWLVQYHVPEIKTIVLNKLLNSWIWLWLLYIVISYNIK